MFYSKLYNAVISVNGKIAEKKIIPLFAFRGTSNTNLSKTVIYIYSLFSSVCCL